MIKWRKAKNRIWNQKTWVPDSVNSCASLNKIQSVSELGSFDLLNGTTLLHTELFHGSNEEMYIKYYKKYACYYYYTLFKV